jgi:hypothetical protein
MPAIALVWSVPLVAAVAALVLVLAWSRKLEDLSLELARELQSLRALRRPLVELRDELDHSGPLVDEVQAHWDH